MAIKFYQSLPSDIEVLSFDLDDTLYQNEDVIRKAEQAQFDAVCQLLPQAKTTGIKHWAKLKWQVAKASPELCHDVSLWRFEVIKLGLAEFGVTDNQLVQQVYDAFYAARSDFVVPEQTFEVLAQLAQRFKLIAVTNGNVDIKQIGLADYFEGYYRAGEQGCRMKPYPDMLEKAIADMSLSSASNILHLGDNVGSDIKAAQNAGVASLWFNPKQKAYPRGYALPTGEYSELSGLLLLA